MDAQSSAHLALIALILVGNLSQLKRRRRP
jgi:hypothetical protein